MSGRTHQITIAEANETFSCDEESDLLTAMRQAGCHGIPVGCCNGGCGACRICIADGAFETGKMNRAVITEDDQKANRALACKVYPRGDLDVQVLGRAWRPSTASSTSTFKIPTSASTPSTLKP